MKSNTIVKKENIIKENSNIKEKISIKEKINKSIASIIRKIELFFIIGIAISILWILKELLKNYGIDIDAWFQDLPIIYPLIMHFKEEIYSNTFKGIIYLFSLSSLFFLPIPLEIAFAGILKLKDNPSLVIIATITGIIIGQNVNYLIGRVFSFFTKNIKKKNHKIIEFLKKYGVYALIGIHLSPLPFPFLNFISGALKFPYRKWVITTSITISARIIIIYLLIEKFQLINLFSKL
jgi:membrane protein YqaA with SNARE-associated domain